MSDVEVEEVGGGLYDVRVGGRRVAEDLIDMDEVTEVVRDYYGLPCEADLIGTDGYREPLRLG